MKRTLLITLDFPPRSGGVAKYWGNLCQYLPEKDFKVLAMENQEASVFDTQQKYSIYRQKLISGSKFIWPKWLPLLRHVFHILRQEKIEHLMVAEVLPTGTVAWLINFLFKIPYTLSFHGTDIAWAVKQKRKQWLVKIILKKAHSIISNSQYTADLIISFFPEVQSKISVVYPSASLMVEGSQVESLPSELITSRPIILSVGRLVERKGFDRGIEAINILKKEFPEILYVIVGQGPYEKTLKKLILDKGLGNWVKIYTEVSDLVLPAFYQAAQVFLMPNRRLPDGDVEGFGIVFLEAGYYGLPVIGGRSGGVPEAIEPGVTGLLVDGEKPSEVAQAVTSLLKDPQKAKLYGQQGKARLKNKFSWPLQAQKIINILK